MSLGKIVIAIAVFIGINLFNKTEPKFLKILLIGLILSFLASFLDVPLAYEFSMLSFAILVLGFFIYSLYYKNWLPASISIFALVSFIFKVQHWPYGSEIQLAMIIPIILFIITLFNFKKFKNQISILIIIASYEISEVIRFIDYIIVSNS